MIEIVGIQIVDGVLLRGRPHVHVDVTIVERDENPPADMRHDVPSEMAAGIREPVRKPARLGQQQQAHGLVDEGAENDEVGLDGVVGAVGPVIRNAGDARRYCRCSPDSTWRR